MNAALRQFCDSFAFRQALFPRNHLSEKDYPIQLWSSRHNSGLSLDETPVPSVDSRSLPSSTSARKLLSGAGACPLNVTSRGLESRDSFATVSVLKIARKEGLVRARCVAGLSPIPSWVGDRRSGGRTGLRPSQSNIEWSAGMKKARLSRKGRFPDATIARCAKLHEWPSKCGSDHLTVSLSAGTGTPEPSASLPPESLRPDDEAGRPADSLDWMTDEDPAGAGRSEARG